MRNIGVNGDLVTGKVVVDEKAAALVDHQTFCQRSANAHRHRSDHLTARRLRVEDATGCADSKHAPNSDFSGRGIDTDLDEMCAKG